MAIKKTIGRVKVPTNIDQMLNLADAIYQKHLADGANSPLKSMADFDLSKLGPDIPKILAKHLEAESLKKKSEEAYRERDLLLPEIQKMVRSAATLLKGVHAKNPKRLGDWGFVVDDTPKIKKPATDENSNP